MEDRLASLWQELGRRTDYERCERPRASRFSLVGMEALVARLGHPERASPVLHVAGSKGKGTVCHFLERALRASGFRTGLYTSPHLSDWRERVQISGVPAADPLLADALERTLGSAAGDETFFDLLTAAAFDAFRMAEVQIAVVEVGLGGRADSTNVVRPLAAAVTSIEGEHLEVLGPTLADVAREKAGIFKAGAQLWCGEDLPPEALAVVEASALRLSTPLRRAFATAEPMGLSAHPLRHTRRHGALAHAMLESLPAPWSRAAEQLHFLPREGLSVPGRWELRRLADGREAILDVAHTENSLRPLLAAFRAAYPDPRNRGVLIALREEKDPIALARALGPAPAGERWWAAPAGDHPRSADPRALAAAFGASVWSTPDCPPGPRAWLVTGSTYLVGALRPQTYAVECAEAVRT